MADLSRPSRNSHRQVPPPKKAPPQKKAKIQQRVPIQTSAFFDPKNLLDFGWWAKQATSRAPILKGLLPTVGTLFTLLTLALAITGVTFLWTGATATLATFFPVYASASLAVVGASLLNFWFHRDITTALTGSREVRKKFKFNEHNPTDLYKLVNDVREELNAYFRNRPGHVDLQMPRLCVYSSEKAELQVTLGRSSDKAALFFSSAFFDSHNTRWNQDHLKALVAHKLTQVYYRRGWSSTIVSIAGSLLQTLEMMQNSEEWYYRALGLLAGPARFFFFVQRAVERSYAYEATDAVVGINRGMDFYDAIDIKVAPSLYKQPTYSYLLFDQERKKRQPYTGFLSGWLGPWIEKLDNLVLTEDRSDKKGYRIISWIDAIVRESIYSFNEMFSKEPRTTRLKDHLRGLLKIGNVGKALIDPKLNDKKEASLGTCLHRLETNGVVDKSFSDALKRRLAQKLGVSGRSVNAYLREPIKHYLQKAASPAQKSPHYKKVLKEIGLLEAEAVRVASRQRL